jgi:hypothetical protein
VRTQPCFVLREDVIALFRVARGEGHGLFSGAGFFVGEGRVVKVPVARWRSGRLRQEVFAAVEIADFLVGRLRHPFSAMGVEAHLVLAHGHGVDGVTEFFDGEGFGGTKFVAAVLADQDDGEIGGRDVETASSSVRVDVGERDLRGGRAVVGEGDYNEVTAVDSGGVVVELAKLDLELRVVESGSKDEKGTGVAAEGGERDDAGGGLSEHGRRTEAGKEER